MRPTTHDLAATAVATLAQDTLEHLICLLDEAPEDLQEALSAAYTGRYPDAAPSLFAGATFMTGKYNRPRPLWR